MTRAILNAKQLYGQSKLANILYAKEMARRLRAIKTVSVHPGSVDTNNIYYMKKNYLHADKLIRCVFPILNAVYRKCGGELLTPDQRTKDSSLVCSGTDGHSAKWRVLWLY